MFFLRMYWKRTKSGKKPSYSENSFSKISKRGGVLIRTGVSKKFSKINKRVGTTIRDLRVGLNVQVWCWKTSLENWPFNQWSELKIFKLCTFFFTFQILDGLLLCIGIVWWDHFRLGKKYSHGEIHKFHIFAILSWAVNCSNLGSN